jgi:hypothetical protein
MAGSVTIIGIEVASWSSLIIIIEGYLTGTGKNYYSLAFSHDMGKGQKRDNVRLR